jgi:hypothetical protein
LEVFLLADLRLPDRFDDSGRPAPHPGDALGRQGIGQRGIPIVEVAAEMVEQSG